MLEDVFSELKSVNDTLNVCAEVLTISRGNKLCDYTEFDETKLWRGYSVKINDYITIRQPSIDEIIDYGDNKYFGMVHTLCSVGADLKWQLDDIDVDYTQISDYDLFCKALAKGFDVSRTGILFGDNIDFSKMEVAYNKELKENVLVQPIDNKTYVQVDRYVYSSIVDVLRKMHKLKRNGEVPGNEATRKILIEDAREEYEFNKSKPTKPYLLPLISAMVNSEGFKRSDETVGDMKIYAFMDSVARIGKIKTATLLLQSGYSGFGINLKDIDKDEINWMGDLS